MGGYCKEAVWYIVEVKDGTGWEGEGVFGWGK